MTSRQKPSVLDQIGSFSFEATQLFFNKNRLGEEAALNLASISGGGTGVPDAEISQVICALQEAISRMEIQTRRLLKHGRAIFYMWHDEQAALLRWTIISDVGQAKLPFSSETNEVDISAVVKKWASPPDDSGLFLTLDEVEKMTLADLRKLNRDYPSPTINVFVRRISTLLAP